MLLFFFFLGSRVNKRHIEEGVVGIILGEEVRGRKGEEAMQEKTHSLFIQIKK